jgi:hypothetical protein
MSFAIDVNILLYASDAESANFPKAKAFIDECIGSAGVFYLPWPVVMGFLRMATHPAIFRNPLTPDQAMANVETLISLPHARLLAEEEGFWECYRRITADVPTRGNLVPDAHLAALLQLHGVRVLYTHDRDFLKFPFLKVKDPLS